MKNLMSLYGSNENTIINVYTIYIKKIVLYCFYSQWKLYLIS